jgi:hypothetical protein
MHVLKNVSSVVDDRPISLREIIYSLAESSCSLTYRKLILGALCGGGRSFPALAATNRLQGMI